MATNDLITVDITKGWSTHMPVLISLFGKTTGPIMEVGSGVYSTPLLHWLCSLSGRALVTYEKDANFIRLANEYRDTFHEVHLVNDYADIPQTGRFGFIFIDHCGHDRGNTVVRLKDNADYVVIHDSNVVRKNAYQVAFPHFKYRKDYDKEIPWTTVLSNSHDTNNLW